jgi:sugar phosphate isomerase/epimerase
MARARQHRFDGLEANLHHPVFAGLEPAAIAEALAAAGLSLIVELVTGGDYVPDLALSPRRHLQELAAQLQQAQALQPRRITVITGSDSWTPSIQRTFLADVVRLAGTIAVPVSFETHRSRSLFNPWAITDLLEAVPQLRLTADLSHWCCVSERLMTPELEPIQAMAERVDHIHARVGHAQGPSVGHPFAPEASEALEAHRRCWQLFTSSQQARGLPALTVTPEFGPDGYLPCLPFTGEPVADLLEINSAMAAWLRQGGLQCSLP